MGSWSLRRPEDKRDQVPEWMGHGFSKPNVPGFDLRRGLHSSYSNTTRPGWPGFGRRSLFRADEMECKTTIKTQSKQERLEQNKKRLTETFEEVLLWLDDAREDTCYEQLFDYSFPAAELAAILGFDKPPFEHPAPVQFDPDGQVRNKQASVQPRIVRVNTPIGMSSFQFYLEEPLAGTLMRESNPRVYEELRSFVMKWMRALSRLDIREVKPAECVMAMYDESVEALIFQEQHERELRGDTRSFLQDSLTESYRGLRLAKLHNLSPEQTTQLMHAMGRLSAVAHPWNQTASASPPAEATAPMPRTGHGMSCDEASRKARDLLDLDADFRDKGQREWADEIGCSVGLVAKLPVWLAVMEETGRSRKTKAANASKRPKAVSMTGTVLAVTGEDQDPSEIAATEEAFRKLPHRRGGA